MSDLKKITEGRKTERESSYGAGVTYLPSGGENRREVLMRPIKGEALLALITALVAPTH
jgi:hypothetical protein